MKNISRILAGSTLVAALGVVAEPTFSQTLMPIPSLTVPSVHHHPAPGPIAGAGLPVLAVGYGVYWLLRRRRKAD
jgi:hypothetical protein